MSDPSALEDLLTAHRQRLAVLLHTQARMGIETPAQTVVEINEIRRVLERAKSVASSPMAAALDVASPGQRTELLSNEVRWAVDRLSSQIDTKLEFLEERIDRQFTGMEAQIDHQFTRRDTWLIIVAVMLFLLTLIVAMIVTYLYLV